MTDEQCKRICDRISIGLGGLGLLLVFSIGLGLMGVSINIRAASDKIVCSR